VLLFFHAFGCFVKSATTGQCKGYNSNYFTIPAFTLYLLERILRVVRSREPTRITSVIFHPGNTLEIRFQKPQLRYQSGQYIYICVPELSRFQWHPFTISSAPDEGFVSIHIRLVGDWTNALARLLQQRSATGGNYKASLMPEILIDGPYGAPAQDLFNYEVAALVSAGIGVTPSASLLKDVWFRYMHSSPMRLKKLYFIWIARDKHEFEWFQSLLSTLEKSIPKEFLEIQIYLTGNLGMDDIHNIALTDELMDVDPITELQTRCHFGRPHWNKILGTIKATQFNPDKPTRLGVFYCGPHALGHVIQKFAQKHSEDKFEFRLHKEHF
jgi:NADPH oxidase